MKSVLLITLMALVAVFLPVLHAQEVMIQPCQMDEDCPMWGPCQYGAVCTNGVCLYANMEDGTFCEPKDWCFTNGTCSMGECLPTLERDCSAYDGECSTGVCNSELARCEPEFDLFGTICDADVGPCEHPGVCSGSSMYCEYPGFFEDGEPCDGGDFCLVGETCQSGQCQGGTGRDCSGAGDMCNSGVCDEQLDQCVKAPLASETPCSTGIPGGICLDAEMCDGQGACVQVFKEEGTLCRQGDGTPCNPDETCSGESAFCPIDIIDQSEFCRLRPLNCVGDDCEECDTDDDQGWLLAILIIVIVILVVLFVIMFLVFWTRSSRTSDAEPIISSMYHSGTKTAGSPFVSMMPKAFQFGGSSKNE